MATVNPALSKPLAAQELLVATWPPALLACPAAAELLLSPSAGAAEANKVVLGGEGAGGAADGPSDAAPAVRSRLRNALSIASRRHRSRLASSPAGMLSSTALNSALVGSPASLDSPQPRISAAQVIDGGASSLPASGLEEVVLTMPPPPVPSNGSPLGTSGLVRPPPPRSTLSQAPFAQPSGVAALPGGASAPALLLDLLRASWQAPASWLSSVRGVATL